MKHFALILSFFLAFILADAQKINVLADNDIVVSFLKSLPGYLRQFNLDDLRSSKDSLAIRIWTRNDIVTIKAGDSILCDLKIHISKKSTIVSNVNFSSQTSKSLLDSLLKHNVMGLHDERQVKIDGDIVVFEISTPDKYRVLSFMSPDADRNKNCKSAVEILNTLNKTLNLKQLRKEFLESLESGDYLWGMSLIRVDRFLDNNIPKTDLYSLVKDRMKNELNISDSTSHLDFPIFSINDHLVKIAEINNYSLKDVKRIEVLTDEKMALVYGSNAFHGLILINIK